MNEMNNDKIDDRIIDSFQYPFDINAPKTGLWELDTSNGKISINGKLAELIGYSSQGFEQSNFSQYVGFCHPEDLKASEELLKKYFAGQSDHFENDIRVKHKQGHWVWFNVKGKVIEWDNNQKVGRMVGYYVYIPKITNTEELLIRKEKILSALTMSIKEFLDNNDYLTAVNKSFQLLGDATGVEEIYLFQNSESGIKIRAKWSSEVLFSGEDTSSALNKDLIKQKSNFIKALKKGECYFIKTKDIEDDKVREYLLANKVLAKCMIPIYVNGVMWGVVELYDYTFERKWSEAEISALEVYGSSLESAIERNISNKELEKSKRVAEMASVLKSEFLASMSHEIRTPMNGIIGFLELLNRSHLTKEQYDYVNEIRSASDILLMLVNDILDYSKIEADKLELEYIQFDMHSLVKECSSLFVPKACEKGVSIKLNIPENIPNKLYGDPVRLKQVLYNIISNAVKFTDKGEIDVSILLLEDDKNFAKLQIQVKDTGIGMGEEVLSKLFNVFTQADASTSRNYGGTGLGLAICKRIVNLMGGNIKVESTPCVGSNFFIEIVLDKTVREEDRSIIKNGEFTREFLEPVVVELNNNRKTIEDKLQDNIAIEKKYTGGNGNTKRYKVLLVEDTIANQKLATIMLGKLGYDVELAENGQEAVDKCNQSKYDIILMDCQMPVMDGYDASINIRRQGMNKNTAIIAMTANAMLGDKDKCLEVGMDDYISKPIILHNLDRIIKNWIEEK